MDLNRSLLRRAPFDFIDHKTAKEHWATFRDGMDLSPKAVPLLSMPEANAKMVKTAKHGIYVCGLALASSDVSGVNVCRYATPECKRGCLTYAGQNNMPYQRRAQIAKTLFLDANPEAFLTLLAFEIIRVQKKYERSLRIRLNMLSDLQWEEICPELFERFGGVAFYDYTKWPFGKRTVPANYQLTFSASERTSEAEIKEMVAAGARVAVVFNLEPAEAMVREFRGMRVVDGDANDDRWLNAAGTIIGLRAKGRMRRGEWGFVRDVA